MPRQTGIEYNPDLTLFRSVGCESCSNTGYRGRTGIYELVMVDERLRTLIHDQASEAHLLQHVRPDNPSLAADGHRKVCAGLTTLDEVLRVTVDT